VTVHFSEAVNVSGVPSLQLSITPSHLATYASGTGTNSLHFSYTVQANDFSSRLDYASTTALSLEGGTIRDSSLNSATLTLPAVASSGLFSQNIVIDSRPLTVTVNQKSTQNDPTNLSTIAFDVQFNKAIDVSTFTVADISESGSVSAAGWTITNPSSDHQNFIITTTGVSSSGTVIPLIAADLVQDLAGNLNIASNSTDHSVTYDLVAPTVLSVTTTAPSGSYTVGTSVNVTVNFSEPVVVMTAGGTPSVNLNTVPSKSASYASGSGTSSLVFAYTVMAGDSSARLDYSAITALALGGGTVKM